MAKKKKKQEVSLEEVSSERNFKIDLASDAKRSAAAVLLLALALLIVLGFLGKAGVVGEYLDAASAKLLGMVKIIFPLFLILAAGVLLFRKKTVFYVTKIIGLSIILFNFTGFIHWFYDKPQMLEMAEKGQGGGYVGYVMAYLSLRYLGSAGSMVTIMTLFFIGIIVAFNFSILNLIERLFKKDEAIEGEKEEDGDSAQEKAEMISPGEVSQANVPTALGDSPVLENSLSSSVLDLQKNNIGRIQFAQGKDQFLSPDIQDKVGRELSERRKNSFDKKLLASKKNTDNDENAQWMFPPLELLERTSEKPSGGDIENNFSIIERTLNDFGIAVERGESKVGPAVTQYSFRPAVGVKIAKILSLQNDLALALAKHPIRIEAPIPGKSLVGIEVPNSSSAMVRFRDILEDAQFRERENDLMIVLGRDVSGSCVLGDISKMPHLMIAGSTGTGKSVCVNSIITALLYQNSPDDLRFIMVDPKRVELSLYNNIPHLLTDVIVENKKVISALRWAVNEMERRYRLLQEVGSRDIASYKEQVKKGKKRKVKDVETGKEEEFELENFPYVVIVIDELADLMASNGKEVEGAIVRIAQMARAVGIHLIVSTQRPSVEVLTGLIKANITTRIAFQVATQIDSRTILDMAGAEKLIGKGDMLYLSASSPKPKRIQGVFITEAEVKKVVKFIKDQKKKEKEIEENILKNEKNTEVKEEEIKAQNTMEFRDVVEEEQTDPLYEEAKEEVIRSKKASASFLQRRLRVGYARAARLLDILEEKGVVGPGEGAKPREIYGVSEQGEVAYESVVEDQEKRDKWQI